MKITLAIPRRGFIIALLRVSTTMEEIWLGDNNYTPGVHVVELRYKYISPLQQDSNSQPLLQLLLICTHGIRLQWQVKKSEFVYKVLSIILRDSQI